MKQTFDRLVDDLMDSGFFLEEAVEILERTLITRTLERGLCGWMTADSFRRTQAGQRTVHLRKRLNC